MMWLAAICIALVTGLGLVPAIGRKSHKIALLLAMVISIVAIYALIGAPSLQSRPMPLP